LPEHDKDYRRMDELKDEMVMALGGRIAEEIIFGKDKISSGAQSDIKGITQSARRMVTQWGMSEKLGTLLYDNNSEEVFLGHSVTQSKNLSDSTADIIDKEVKELVDEATEKCNKILKDNIKELHIVAKGLIEYETLTLKEVKDLIKGIAPSRDNFDNENSDDSSESSTTIPSNTSPKLKPEPQTNI